VVLELMKVLPEECCNHNVVVADERREAYRRHLCASAPQLLSFLSEVAAGPLGGDVMVQETVFQCLQSWVRYTDIAPAELAAHPLFPAAFDALRTPDLFEAAADLLVQVRVCAEAVVRCALMPHHRSRGVQRSSTHV
jgi:transportin-3